MRVLFISNFSTVRCGVRVFGDLMADALERAGVEVTRWDGAYPTIAMTGRYLPHRIDCYDLVHLNWDPQAINHYLPLHFSSRETPPLSLFLHDVPPNSTCPIFEQARWRWGFEPAEGVEVFEEPIPPTPSDLPAPAAAITIGVSGIRDDPGTALVQQVAAERGWTVSLPDWQRGGVWKPVDAEIRRLASSTINVCWYHTSGRGKSMAAAFCCAARRPLLCSGSSMFSALWPYSSELYLARETHQGGEVRETWYQRELGRWLDLIVGQIERGTERVPTKVCRELAWDRQIAQVVRAWRGHDRAEQAV